MCTHYFPYLYKEFCNFSTIMRLYIFPLVGIVIITLVIPEGMNVPVNMLPYSHNLIGLFTTDARLHAYFRSYSFSFDIILDFSFLWHACTWTILFIDCHKEMIIIYYIYIFLVSKCFHLCVWFIIWPDTRLKLTMPCEVQEHATIIGA